MPSWQFFIRAQTYPPTLLMSRFLSSFHICAPPVTRSAGSRHITAQPTITVAQQLNNLLENSDGCERSLQSNSYSYSIKYVFLRSYLYSLWNDNVRMRKLRVSSFLKVTTLFLKIAAHIVWKEMHTFALCNFYIQKSKIPELYFI